MPWARWPLIVLHGMDGLRSQHQFNDPLDGATRVGFPDERPIQHAPFLKASHQYHAQMRPSIAGYAGQIGSAHAWHLTVREQERDV